MTKGDISTLDNRGHFYFALTPRDAAWGMDMAVVPSFEICVQVTMALRELA